jgi:hypothetical protein
MKINEISKNDWGHTRQDDEKVNGTNDPEEGHIIAELSAVRQERSEQRKDDGPAQYSNYTRVWRKDI